MAPQLHDIARRHHIALFAHHDRKAESTFRECAIRIDEFEASARAYSTDGHSQLRARTAHD